MTASSQLLTVGLGALVIVGLIMACKQTKQNISVREPYQDTFYAKDYSKGNWVSRPNFRADMDPRFDATRVSGGQIVGTFPGMGVQGAPVTPVAGLVSAETESNPNFATMGGIDGAYADARLPSGGLSTSQINEVLAGKFGRNSPAYTDPKMLLPVPDMKKALARDPSDPGTFMYDRYLFAPLKRRYGQVDVDHIRGDLAIPQLRTGWFDTNPVAAQDLIQGYFQDYLDIAQATALKDSVFERAPTPVDDVNPWGRLSQQTAWSML